MEKIRKAKIKVNGKAKPIHNIITVRWDGVNCIWRDFDHRGTYTEDELEFIKNRKNESEIEDDFGDDFLYFLDEKMVKELEGKYPEKFEEYQMRKDVKNYNI